MKSQADHQLVLPLSGESTPRMVKTTRAANKKRGAEVAQQAPALPLREKRFLPVVGVPKTRGECPVERPCPHVRCRQHLFLEDAEHRAGRPGLSSVKRNERGWTVSQPGEAGRDRAGTTLNPRWLRIDGEPAEAERVCPAWIWFDDAMQPVVHLEPARWDHMNVRVGDALDVINRIDGKRATWARVGADDSIVFEEMPDSYESMFVWIVRKRQVQSCALDVVDAHGAVSNDVAGQHIARHRTLVARVMRSGLRKAVANGEQMGIEREDLMGALMQMGSGSRGT